MRALALGSRPVRRQGRRVQKKSPASAWKTGDLPACTLHSLILEDLSVKITQAGFLTLGSSYFLRLPTLRPRSQDSGLLQGSSPNTAAGPSPLSPSEKELRGSLRLDIIEQDKIDLANSGLLCQVFLGSIYFLDVMEKVR